MDSVLTKENCQHNILDDIGFSLGSLHLKWNLAWLVVCHNPTIRISCSDWAALTNWLIYTLHQAFAFGPFKRVDAEWTIPP